MTATRPAAYWNPYLAGLLLGATLLASFLILGAGLGASAGPARLGAFLEQCVAARPRRRQRLLRPLGRRRARACCPTTWSSCSRACFWAGCSRPSWPGGSSVGVERGEAFGLRLAAAAGAGGGRAGGLRQPAGQRLHLGPGPQRRRDAAQRQPRLHGLRLRRRLCGGLVRTGGSGMIETFFGTRTARFPGGHVRRAGRLAWPSASSWSGPASAARGNWPASSTSAT